MTQEDLLQQMLAAQKASTKRLPKREGESISQLSGLSTNENLFLAASGWEPLDICWAVDAGADHAHLERLAGEGITWGTIGFPATDRRTYIDALRRFADQIRS